MKERASELGGPVIPNLLRRFSQQPYIPALGSGIKYAFTAHHISDPTVLSHYTGSGSRHLVVYDCGGNLTDHISLTGSGTVTYNYNPPSPPHHTIPTWYSSIIRFTLMFAGPVTPPPGSPVEAIVGLVDLERHSSSGSP